MFNRIMIPVDLAHTDTVQRTLAIAAGLARMFDAELHLVGVTVVTPSEVAHSPAEYREKLERYAEERSEELGVRFRTLAIESSDLAIDLDRCLTNAADELDADLIVMASHVPHFGDWLVHSHARWLAAHDARSMFIVR